MGKFFKIAKPVLLPHQEDALSKLDDVDSLLLYHGMGSGKTLTALEAADKLKREATIVGPAALKDNFRKEKDKHKSEGDFKYYSYHKPPEEKDHDLVIFDEAHLMGQPTSQRSHYPDEYKGEKEIYMTGTPLRNHPSELIPLMRGLGIDISRDPSKFKDKYIDEVKVNPSLFSRIFKGIKPGVEYKAKNLKSLEKDLKDKVHYYQPSLENYPEVKEEEIRVPMSETQLATYYAMMKDRPSLAYKIKYGLPPSKAEATLMNSFLSASRQISNTPDSFNESATAKDSPKLNKATEEIVSRIKKDPNYRGVTYSNYLASGVDPMARRLEEEEVPYAEFTGRLSDEDKKQIIEDFNKGKYKHLLLSGAGAEGLDLKGVKLMQILEPHWNTPKLDQVKARAVRYKSHDHLPDDEKKVVIQNYKSTLPDEKGVNYFISKLLGNKKKYSTDEYLYNLSERKKLLNEQFLDVLKREGLKKKAGVTKVITKPLKEKAVPFVFDQIRKRIPSKMEAATMTAEGAVGFVLQPGATFAAKSNWKTKPNVVDDWIVPWPFEGAPWTAQVLKDLKRNKKIVDGKPYEDYKDTFMLAKPTLRKDNKPLTGTETSTYAQENYPTVGYNRIKPK